MNICYELSFAFTDDIQMCLDRRFFCSIVAKNPLEQVINFNKVPDLKRDTKEILKKMCLGFKGAFSAPSGCISAAVLALTSDSLPHLSANLALSVASPEKPYRVSNIPALLRTLTPAEETCVLQLQVEA